MKEKRFESYWGDVYRPVKVRIKDGFITFHFAEEGDREFYWIAIDDWFHRQDKDRPDSCEKHMREKNWYSDEIHTFIVETLKDPKIRNAKQVIEDDPIDTKEDMEYE